MILSPNGVNLDYDLPLNFERMEMITINGVTQAEGFDYVIARSTGGLPSHIHFNEPLAATDRIELHYSYALPESARAMLPNAEAAGARTVGLVPQVAPGQSETNFPEVLVHPGLSGDDCWQGNVTGFRILRLHLLDEVMGKAMISPFPVKVS